VPCRASVPEAAYFSVCSLSGVFEGGGAGVSEDATKGVCLALTVGEARALLYAYDINEFPVSNPLGRDGGDLLDTAEEKLKAALKDAGHRWD
jgi:hypothetical protein